MAKKPTTGKKDRVVTQAHGDAVLPAVNPAVDDHAGPPESLPFPIVAIGASAGGLGAFNALIGAVPADTGMAFVVVQHLSPTHESLLSEILQRATKLPVRQVENNMPVEPDHVYVIPPGKKLVISRGLLQLAPRTEVRGQPRAIDHFMRSLAEEHGHKSIGVVLSGTANDGSLGIQEIKAAGGITFAQDDSAEQPSMPRSAIATGAIDFVLAPEAIGRELGRIAHHPYVRPAPGALTLNEGSMQRVLTILKHATDVDFAGYKRNTLNRRITRRMVLNKLESLADYVRFLQGSPQEIEALYQDVLINVTSFFRNPEAYEALKTHVFPALTRDRSRHEPVRIWALGCSTGEEAYSLAMAFVEYIEATGKRAGAQIFATDLNGAGIEKARTGLYSKAIVEDVSAERLRRFFTEVDGSYRVSKAIRDMCVFARQNALADPPFSRLDLVACRNLLIYLDATAQQRVIPMLHYALRGGGFLWLGASETIGAYRDFFEAVDPKHKIFARTPGAARGLPSPAATVRREPATRMAYASPVTPRVRESEAQRGVDRLMLARYAPPAVVVSDALDILQFRGDTSAFIAPAPGRATLNLLKMLREGLEVGVSAAIARARRDRKSAREEGMRTQIDGGTIEVGVQVVPLEDDAASWGAFLVVFEEPAASLEARARALLAQARAETRRGTRGADEIPRLQHELDTMREYLQSVIDQQEAANEELQSANEEAQSANEEMQSINEELETSKEEIQSTNEELVTVNDELNNRNAELSRTLNDLNNLVASVQLPVLIVDRHLRIRRFTPAAERLFTLVEGDLGRRLADVRLAIDIPFLVETVSEVMEAMSVRDREVLDSGGRWYSLRVRPYRTLDNVIDGAVLVLVDIDDVKKAEHALLDLDRGRNEFLAVLAHELRNPLSGVRNASRLLTEGSDPRGLKEAREIIEHQAQNMVRIVDDLLDVARIAHGKITLRREPVDLIATVRRIVRTTEHEREQNQQTLTLAVPDAPLVIMADPVRIEQVVSNLLGNASKFTRHGGRVWLTLERERAQRGDGAVAVLRVRDNGVGIEAAMLPRIFDLFMQADRVTERSRAGIGLGLTLAKQLVDLHGGSIEAFSAGESLGSEFVVRLPALDASAASTSMSAGRGREDRDRRYRLLVVDDNRDSAESLRLILSMAGNDVSVVHEGARAVAAAAEFQPDAILLDIGLPDLDGYHVASNLRGDSRTSGALIVAVTGYGRDEDVARAREAGIDGHMTKPIDPVALLAMIDRSRSSMRGGP